MAAPKTDTTASTRTGGNAPDAGGPQTERVDPATGTISQSGSGTTVSQEEIETGERDSEISQGELKGRRKRARSARGTGPGRPERKLYIAFDPQATVDSGGEVQVVMHTFRAEELLAHIDANRTHKYITVNVR